MNIIYYPYYPIFSILPLTYQTNQYTYQCITYSFFQFRTLNSFIIMSQQLQQKHFRQNNQLLNQKNTKYKCLICYKASKNPVLTTCGHMFCWSCLYKKINQLGQCPECKSKCKTSQCYPIFIDCEQSQKMNSNQIQRLPDRPKAFHQQKILNANMIGGGMPLASNNIPNNIVLGKLMSGYSFSPSLAFQSLNNISENGIVQQDTQAGRKFRIKMHFLLIIAILVLIIYVF